MDPATQKYPALHAPLHWLLVCATALPYRPAAHSPEQAAEGSAVLLPKVPVGQSIQDAEPATLYLPMGHVDAWAVVDPAAHAYPAWQSPEQAEVVDPPLPNLPAGQVVHEPAPPTLN